MRVKISEDNRIILDNFEVVDHELIQILNIFPEDQWENTIRSALRFGLLMVRDFQVSGKVDWIEKQFMTFQNQFDKQYDALQLELNSFFGEKGTVTDLFDLEKRGSLLETLQNSIVGPEGILTNMLDPSVENSPMAKFEKTFHNEFSQLRDKILELSGESRAREKGTQKGFDFEDQVYAYLEPIAQIFGDEVQQVGMQEEIGSKVGDLIIDVHEDYITPKVPRIVIEAKDRATVTLHGRTGILHELQQAISNRQGTWGIAVVKDDTALPNAVGNFRHYNPNMIACCFGETGLPLEVAYKFARCRAIAECLKTDELADIDTKFIYERTEEVTTILNQIREMKRKLTGMNNLSNEIRALLDGMKGQIEEKINDIHVHIRSAVPPDPI